MDRLLYVAMTGARQTMQAQAMVTNNLANANTTGYREDLGDLRSMPVFNVGLPTRVYAMAERPAVDLSAGPQLTTGRGLDLAVQGEGWIAVQAPDGTEAYTRAGDLQLTPNGLLVTGAGHPVLGDGGPIAVPPADAVEIGSDGTVSVQPLGGAVTTRAQVGRVRLVRSEPERLIKAADGLMRTRDGEPLAPDASIRVRSGTLEGSNVDTIGALVDMIGLARQFEVQIRMMRAAQEKSSASDRLIGGQS